MKHIFFFYFPLIVALFLGGASRAQTAEAGASTAMPTEYIYIDNEGVHRPQSAANYIYRVLVSEIALNEGEYDLAGQGLIELAQDTQDPRFAERAFKLAMVEQDISIGLEAERLWRMFDPDDQEAHACAM